MNRSGDLLRIRRGLYIRKDDPEIPRSALAGIIYGPSYLSFEYALSIHGLIPERVEVVTSAVYGKNKTKTFRTPLGEFRYYLVPEKAYPYGVERITEGPSPYLLATAEKSLCDTLIRMAPVAGYREMEDILIAGLRMERDDISKLDLEAIRFLAPLYRRSNVNALQTYLEKR